MALWSKCTTSKPLAMASTHNWNHLLWCATIRFRWHAPWNDGIMLFEHPLIFHSIYLILFYSSIFLFSWHYSYIIFIISSLFYSYFSLYISIMRIYKSFLEMIMHMLRDFWGYASYSSLWSNKLRTISSVWACMHGCNSTLLCRMSNLKLAMIPLVFGITTWSHWKSQTNYYSQIINWIWLSSIHIRIIMILVCDSFFMNFWNPLEESKKET